MPIIKASALDFNSETAIYRSKIIKTIEIKVEKVWFIDFVRPLKLHSVRQR